MNKLFDAIKPYTDAIGRVLIAIVFLVSGWRKIGDFPATQSFMQHAGVPGFLLPLVILLELGGGVAIVVGLWTRPLALLFAIYCVLATMIFHSNSTDHVQHLMFLKDLGLAGGFLFLFASGAGRLSVDAWLSSRSANR